MPATEEDIAWLKSSFRPIPRPVLPDDCIEYSLYLFSSSLDYANDSERRIRLRDVQKFAFILSKQWLKDYIWQRQGLTLELAKEDGEVCMRDIGLEDRLTSETGVSLLRGRTEYGDSIEDEWVVVWLLREVSKKFPDLWIKLNDNDGEFLLIEASGTIPTWLEPDIAENRIWVNQGSLKIIRPRPSGRSSRRTAEKLSLSDARDIILREPKRLMHSISVEEEAFFRLKDYPGKINENMHHALLRLPRKIAFLLKQKPSYVSPAIEAFYVRDPVSLKPLRSAKVAADIIFGPDDLVALSVKLPRVGYAQLKSQDFPSPPIWQAGMPTRSNAKSFSQADTGMKLACGFEMLLTDPHHQDKPAVREMKMLLDDVASGDEHLPTNEQVSGWDQTEDDDSWLDVDYSDLEHELSNRKPGSGSKKPTFGDKHAQENLQRIVKQFEDFLNEDKANPGGQGLFDEDSDGTEEVDDDETDDDEDDANRSMPGEDKEASFDEDEFTRMMREMMGMPAHVMDEITKGKMPGLSAADAPTSSRRPADRVREIESGDEEEEEEEEEEDTRHEDIESVMRQMEAELKQSGALDLNPVSSSRAAAASSSRAIDRGERKQTLRSPRNEPGMEEDDDDDHGSASDDEEETREDDADVNLLKNLLESFKAQDGGPGPGGNMLGMLGMRLPRDDGEDADGDGRTGERGGEAVVEEMD